MPRQKATRPDDKRLKANRPPERQARVKPASEKTRWQQLVDGDISVEDLDDEEIRRGQTRDVNGHFQGKAPTRVPRTLVTALRREFEKRASEKFQLGVDVGFQTLLEVALSERAASQARVTAAIALLERGVGKVPDKLESTVELKPFEEDISSLFVDVGVDEVARKRAQVRRRARGNQGTGEATEAVSD